MKSQYISFITVVSATALAFLTVMSKASFAQANQNPSPASNPLTTPTRGVIPSDTFDTIFNIIYAPPENFFCDVRDQKNEKGEVVKKSVPTTMAQTAKGEVVIYFWTKPYYPDSGETPLSRCRRVAQVLSEFIKQGNPDLISLANKNGTPAICAVDKTRNSCDKLVFPLEVDEDSKSILEDFRKAMKGLPISIERKNSSFGPGKFRFFIPPPRNGVPLSRIRGGASR
ncbi:MAG: COP23 domain-containing protein [Nostoc sp. DedQUE01]|nr:COP23 domain-containing protein [Nostoc sp. DedQUE11]MDZ8074235.1 COP23 domain-containing protein [Nostoc sp. DedQUE01]